MMPNDFLHDKMAEDHRMDIRKIAAIMCTADNGCRSCAADLIATLVSEFPDYKDDIYEARSKFEAAGKPGIMGGDLNFDAEGWSVHE